MKRIDRTGAMIKILTEHPSRLYPLSYFTELFGAAKSTISEDIAIARRILEQFDQGEIVTLAGAAGGVKYVPRVSQKALKGFQDEMCRRMSDNNRVLTGGFLFTSDLMFNPQVAKQAGRIFATKFLEAGADYVVTIETKGISLAVMTADALNLPLVVMRRESKISEGSTLSVNYISGFSDQIQKMSVSKKSLMPGTRAIIIDDFMRGGGSASGMVEMLGELDVSVVGIGVLIATTRPQIKRVSEYFPILYLDKSEELEKGIRILPNESLLT